MEERHSDVVSGNQTIVLSLRVCFRYSLTHDDSGRLDWWCRLRHILTDIRAYLCRNQSAPDRIWVLPRPFFIVHLELLNVRKLSLNRPSYTFCVLSYVRGSFSARVPRSSFARLRRALVPHIMEEEGEEKENEKEDEREDGKQRVEGRVVESIKTTTS